MINRSANRVTLITVAKATSITGLRSHHQQRWRYRPPAAASTIPHRAIALPTRFTTGWRYQPVLPPVGGITRIPITVDRKPVMQRVQRAELGIFHQPASHDQPISRHRITNPFYRRLALPTRFTTGWGIYCPIFDQQKPRSVATAFANHGNRTVVRIGMQRPCVAPNSARCTRCITGFLPVNGDAISVIMPWRNAGG